MKELLYITGNEMKFRQAAQTCQQVDILLRQGSYDIPEIQAADGEAVARDKAAKAFALARAPLLVSDDSWIIPGLKGFPGPYMKYINGWLTSDDWLRLTRDVADRTVLLRQVVVYQGADGDHVFSQDIRGTLMRDVRGKSSNANTTIMSFDDGAHSIAEHHEQGNAASAAHRSVWHDFAEWYNSQS